MGARSLLHKFDENAVRAGRVQKRDPRSAGAGPRIPVDDPQARSPGAGDRGRQVRNNEREMVNALTAGGQESAEGFVRIERLHELDPRVSNLDKGDADTVPGQDVSPAGGEAEEAAERPRRRIQTPDNQRDMRQANVLRDRAHRIPASARRVSAAV